MSVGDNNKAEARTPTSKELNKRLVEAKKWLERMRELKRGRKSDTKAKKAGKGRGKKNDK